MSVTQAEFALSSLSTLEVWTLKQRYCIEPKTNQAIITQQHKIILWLNNNDKPAAKVQDNNNNKKNPLKSMC